MKNIIIYVILFFVLDLSAQNPEIIWKKTFGSTKMDEANKIIAMNDGNLLIVGYTQQEGRYDLDLLVMKISNDGELIWQNKFGTLAVENGHDAIELADGSLLVIGEIHTKDKAKDIWLLKIDKDGNLIWSKEFGGIYNDTPKSIVLTKNNEVVIGGVNEEANNVQFAFLMKVDLDGNQLWTKSYDSKGFKLLEEASFMNKKGEGANKVIQTRDGGFLLGGFSMTKALRGVATDAWLCKTDKNGTEIWANTFGGFGGDDLFSIIEDEKGAIYVSGERYDKSKGLVSFYLIKFNAQGEQLFEKYYNEGNFCTKGRGLFYDDKQLLLVGGSNNKPKSYMLTDTITAERKQQLLLDGWEIKESKSGKIYLMDDHAKTGHKRINEDIWLVLTDLDGNLTWSKTFGGDDDDNALSLCKMPNGDIFVAGYTRSEGKGLKDIIVLKVR